MKKHGSSEKADMENIKEIEARMTAWKNIVADSLEEELQDADDITRKSVEAIMEQWIDDIYRNLDEAFALEGRLGMNMEPNIDPVDNKLAREVEELENVARDLTEEVMQLRQTMPENLAPLIEGAIAQESQLANTCTFQEDDDELNEETEPDLDEMAKEYATSMQLLAKLEKDIPSELHKYSQIQELRR
ncbi:hypothetical protein EC973_005105 [Apophysomyces ossiformis]|uniref:Uncharacterized protein n=1 Tax=Apophysomyces ossiformis TaxID=679940 RepID=A0A8H7BHK5_9FUNG|nr:hypothetical protein EC973_005105 [Apophysomyces ossiformis]